MNTLPIDSNGAVFEDSLLLGCDYSGGNLCLIYVSRTSALG